MAPWATPVDDFYLIHTAIVLPTIEPEDWQLRIHGMVDREITLTYQDLLARERTEAWVTLNCVSNPVGGDLIGNAWWSGVRLADLLAEAGVSDGADAVLQTSEDGWTCGTPLSALTDGRDAMLAVAMNGRPLPIEHGFPVRTIVPGLYGFVSASKWVVDIEVTRFDGSRPTGPSRAGPSRARSGSPPGSTCPAPARRSRPVRSASAASPGSSTSASKAVEVAVDGGEWQAGRARRVPTDDTWVQWAGTVAVAPGDHMLRVRATEPRRRGADERRARRRP